jgi:hypothetical protein
MTDGPRALRLTLVPAADITAEFMDQAAWMFQQRRRLMALRTRPRAEGTTPNTKKGR